MLGCQSANARRLIPCCCARTSSGWSPTSTSSRCSRPTASSRRGVRGCFELWFRELPHAAQLPPGRGAGARARRTCWRCASPPSRSPPCARLEVVPGRRRGVLQRTWPPCASPATSGGCARARRVFAGEPVLRVEAPIEQAQLVETYLLAAISFSTLVASKAARVRARGRRPGVVDFGSRRAHGPQAACWAARSARTSRAWTGPRTCGPPARLGVPPSGTMAHSFVLAFASEHEAFQRLRQHLSGPHGPAGRHVRHPRAPSSGPPPTASSGSSRSGSTAATSWSCRKASRAVLDRTGRADVRIVASGDLDEDTHRGDPGRGRPGRLVRRRHPDGDVGRRSPTLQAVYKLVAVEEPGKAVRGVAKRSAGKRTAPGTKQVWRRRNADGTMVEDMITTAGEEPGPGALGAAPRALDHLRSLEPRAALACREPGVRARADRLTAGRGAEQRRWRGVSGAAGAPARARKEGRCLN